MLAAPMPSVFLEPGQKSKAVTVRDGNRKSAAALRNRLHRLYPRIFPSLSLSLSLFSHEGEIGTPTFYRHRRSSSPKRERKSRAYHSISALRFPGN